MQRMQRTQRIRQRGNENSFRVVSGEFKGTKLDFDVYARPEISIRIRWVRVKNWRYLILLALAV